MTSEHADLLRSHGLRVTGPRVAVLESIETGRHVTADEIARQARERLGAVSTQAVYDVLHALVTAGLVRRLEPAGAPAALYETRVEDNHHHVVCRVCGRAEDIDCVVGEAPCLDPSSTGGFLVDQAEVTFWGICPDCQEGREEGDWSTARSS